MSSQQSFKTLPSFSPHYNLYLIQVCYSAINNLLCIFFGSSLCHLLALLHSEQGKKTLFIIMVSRDSSQIWTILPKLLSQHTLPLPKGPQNKAQPTSTINKRTKIDSNIAQHALVFKSLSQHPCYRKCLHLDHSYVTCSVWGTSCTDRFVALNINSECPQCLWGRKEMQVHGKQTQWIVKFSEKQKNELE